jgi:hypothetical protein
MEFIPKTIPKVTAARLTKDGTYKRGDFACIVDGKAEVIPAEEFLRKYQPADPRRRAPSLIKAPYTPPRGGAEFNLMERVLLALGPDNSGAYPKLASPKIHELVGHHGSVTSSIAGCFNRGWVLKDKITGPSYLYFLSPEGIKQGNMLRRGRVDENGLPIMDPE